MQNLITELQNIGMLLTDGHPILDGKPHKLKVVGKQDKRAWYCGVYINDKIYCSFGRFDTDESHKYNNNGAHKLSKADYEILRLINERAAQEEKKKHERASKVAKSLWDKAIPDSNHPYLVKKKILPHISRAYNGILLIPIYSPTGELVNLQRIYPNPASKKEEKKMLFGGEVKGCAACIEGYGKICICEGFATGASIHEATGYSVVIAFFAHNLPAIAESVKKKNPDSEIIICADNDKINPMSGKNTGLFYGQIASEKIGAQLRHPTKEGTDFNDLLHSEISEIIKGLPENIVTHADLKDEKSLTLDIPENVWKVDGLIAYGLQAAIAAGSPDIIQINLPVVLTLIARAVSGKITACKQWPTLYNIKVTPTSVGKSDADDAFIDGILSAGIEKFFGPTDFSSGPGLLRGMTDKPQCLIFLDEAVYLFKRTKQDTVSNSKISALLELYNKKGKEIDKPYGDSKNSIKITNPCLNLIGNATPDIFDNIQLEDLTSGIMQRFDFWMYDGKIPYRDIAKDDNPAMERFISGLSKIMASFAPKKNKHDLSSLNCYNLNPTPNCEKRLKEYSVSTTDEANETDDNAVRGMIMRKYHLCLRYALIHAASIRHIEDLYNPLQLKNLEWGIAVAEMLSKWKINTLTKKVMAGQFHQDCEVFKDAIKSAIKNGKKPTQKIMCHRKKRLRELKPRDWKDIVDTLIATGEILIEGTGSKACFYLTK